MSISNDSYAILLLCSDLALKNNTDELKAFSISQWYKLADHLTNNELKPSDLFNISSENIKHKLNLNIDLTIRIEKLLSRAGQFGIELSELNEKGIYTITIADEEYPDKLKTKLNRNTPPFLYYAGKLSLLNNKGVSVVGSRDIDMAGLEFTKLLSKKCTSDGLNIISGGARGVDSIAENIANESDGTTIIVVADSLERKIKKKETREAILRKQSLIMSSFRPDMPFQAYAAMERNKYVYALSDFVVVVSSDYNKGGTWAGAKENNKYKWTPMFVRESTEMPLGNEKLLKLENVHTINEQILLNKDGENIYDWFNEQVSKEITTIVNESTNKETQKGKNNNEPRQLSLFD